MLSVLFLVGLGIAILLYFGGNIRLIRVNQDDPEATNRKFAEAAREAERLNPLDPRD